MKSCVVLLTGIASLVLLGCSDDSSSGKATCGAFAACGGDLEGTWVIDGSCPEGDLEAYMMEQSELPAACTGVFQNVTMDFAGTVDYTAGTETADMTSTTHVHAVYTAACISAMAGQTITTLTEGACDAAEQGAGQNGGTATCSLVGSSCDCTITINQTIQETDTYTISGSTLTYSDGSTAGFCVAGSKISVRAEMDVGVYMQYTAHR